MPFVYLKNVRIFYEDEGEGLPLIFLHPPGMGHAVFHKQKELTRFFRVLLIDMRGHGKSSSGNDELSISLLADDLENFMDALHIDRAVIIGYSSGGSIAQEFAIHHQHRVAALVLCGGFPEVNDPFLNLEFKAGISLAYNLKALSWIIAKSHAKTEAEFRILRSYFQLTDPEVLKQFYVKGRLYSCVEQLSNLHIPLLHLTGEFAFYFHHYQTMYEKAVPSVRTVRVSNTFHEIPTKSFREFNHAVLAFLTSIKAYSHPVV
ncbi:alpha/beta fold hydrolase [Alkalihalobacillus sp. CinArs1]|uniref:alpha/beta fold hydrolase n=1 Tax=Alkalihalobacillus sp. CinArs1 TaxID=2995314 RepID=UPI0022DE5592|nr:alpha/beta hydrolase [Alkalihalobacillus sp. CinArs1]